MSISTEQAGKLNGMCKGANLAGLGTEVKRLGDLTALGVVHKATYTVTADDQTAGTWNTGDIVDPTIPGSITGFIVQVYRAGKLLGDYAVSTDGASLTVATNGTDYVLTTGDVINYILF